MNSKKEKITLTILERELKKALNRINRLEMTLWDFYENQKISCENAQTLVSEDDDFQVKNKPEWK